LPFGITVTNIMVPKQKNRKIEIGEKKTRDPDKFNCGGDLKYVKGGSTEIY